MEGKGDELLVSVKLKLLNMLFTLFLVDIVVSWLTEELICLIFLDRCDHNVCTSVVSFSFCL